MLVQGCKNSLDVFIPFPQPEDVSRTRRLLLECSRYLRGGELYPDCQFDPARPCRHIPPRCTRYNAVYTILHFLADDSFALPGVSGTD